CTTAVILPSLASSLRRDQLVDRSLDGQRLVVLYFDLAIGNRTRTNDRVNPHSARSQEVSPT
ncbi:hypothetical protein, partial [Ensifer sp. ZNC0028]|uniref:hypothetical protein n=1 Tax=Ensifer sp. ZNC0028 TaxID=1339236 RepID=UPI001AEC27FA